MPEESKNILITGAGSGFGRAMAIRLAREGNNLILNDIDEEGLEETNRLLDKKNIETFLQVGDLSSSIFIKQLLESTVWEFGLLHVIINNAGVSGEPTNVIDVSEDVFDRVMNINFKAYWLISKYGAKIMKKQRELKPIRGKIINIASVAGKEPMPLIGIYSCSKAAVIALTKVLARELAPRITVNAICPGFHVTGIYKNDPKVIEDFLKVLNTKIPLKRLGTAEDVTGLVSFLISKDADYMTGQALNLCGGVVLH
ncbi:MAG: SDR family NAD(P)-dependent oxidoreductase [Candidatus Helarchaeota archaeon]